MAQYRSGEVVLLTLPFTGGAGRKRRPAVVLLDMGDADIIVVPVTSQAARSSFDVPLLDWRQAGLHLASIVRTTSQRRWIGGWSCACSGR
jgi:mRNA interferase MazF